MQREQMYFVIILERAQLAAGHDSDAESVAGRASGSNTSDAVVIGQRDGRKAAPLGRFDYTFRRKRPVGSR